jgi:hypothetical protein
LLKILQISLILVGLINLGLLYLINRNLDDFEKRLHLAQLRVEKAKIITEGHLNTIKELNKFCTKQ